MEISLLRVVVISNEKERDILTMKETDFFLLKETKPT